MLISNLSLFNIQSVVYLLDRYAPARRFSEFFIALSKGYRLSSYSHQLLMLTDTRRTTQRWRSVGLALFGLARKKSPYTNTVALEHYITSATRHDEEIHYLHYPTNTGPLFYLTTID